MHVNEILKAAMDRQATDLHLKVGSHPVIRVEGRLQPMLDMKRLQPEDTLGAAFSLMTARQKEKFKQNLEIDLAYSVPGLGRFRCNVFQQRGSVGLVLRVIPVKVLSFDELGLPAVMEQIAEERSGLVLFAGTTGSGKSTALAAVIEHVNSTRSAHIVTIEDPIEFLHRDKKSLVNQREVDVDTRSIASALRSALRQDPDIVLVGELRDPEVIDLALTAAESGRLVLSTMSTLDAVETINRFVGVFPADQQKHVRLQLAGVLKAIVSMRLAPRAEGRGRVPTAEILRMTPFVRECVENKDRTRHVVEAMASGGAQHGMQTFDQSLWGLLERGLVTRDEALRRATSPEEMKLRLGAQAPPAAAAPSEGVAGAKPAAETKPRDPTFDIGSNF